MNPKTKLRDLIGIIKDKVSLSKATILSKPNTLTLHLSILRATSHDPTNPPSDKHISTVLSTGGHGSRTTASAVIEALMNRLHHTNDSSVALKCLITIHHIITRGSFILQDQLSVYPTFGGRNYLNLSNFRHDSTPDTWVLSSWVRWYATYLEHILSTSRVLGFFFSSSSLSLYSTVVERESLDDKKGGGERERVTSLVNKDLLKETETLVSLLTELTRSPDSAQLEGNKLVYEVMELVGNDYFSIIDEVSIRIDEFKERLSCLSFGDSVELVCCLKRLEDCKEKLMLLFTRKKVFMEMFWDLVSEMRERVGMIKGYNGEEYGRSLLVMRRRGTVSESARFGDRVLKSGDSVRFSSGRFLSINKFEFPIIESVESQV